jgi:putative transposase
MGSFIKRAVSFEPKRVVIPTVAAKDPTARKALLAIQTAFRSAYRRALDAWKSGVRDVVFPPGTWWMRVHHGVATGEVEAHFQRDHRGPGAHPVARGRITAFVA